MQNPTRALERAAFYTRLAKVITNSRFRERVSYGYSERCERYSQSFVLQSGLLLNKDIASVAYLEGTLSRTFVIILFCYDFMVVRQCTKLPCMELYPILHQQWSMFSGRCQDTQTRLMSSKEGLRPSWSLWPGTRILSFVRTKVVGAVTCSLNLDVVPWYNKQQRYLKPGIEGVSCLWILPRTVDTLCDMRLRLSFI